MFCENCGNPITDKDIYCMRCGARINRETNGRKPVPVNHQWSGDHNIQTPVNNQWPGGQNTPDEVLYKVKPKDKVNADGMARGIVAGTYGYGYNNDETCVYIVAANDGKKDYIMELYYPDSAPDYDYDDANYIIDCVYRYCSFAGGSYKPRSSELFVKDDMGEKN